uniref:Uncharacterized protein n=1 Tax=Schistocephalus solidus TaxID=70667 RepID=A0A0X3P513_SCHSO
MSGIGWKAMLDNSNMGHARSCNCERRHTDKNSKRDARRHRYHNFYNRHARLFLMLKPQRPHGEASQYDAPPPVGGGSFPDWEFEYRGGSRSLLIGRSLIAWFLAFFVLLRTNRRERLAGLLALLTGDKIDPRWKTRTQSHE